MLEYIDLGYAPTEKDIVCEYKIQPASGMNFQDVCNNLAGESSIDTWADILTLSPEIAREIKPHVFEVDEKEGLARIAYPTILFELKSVPQILSSIAGNIFSMKLLNNLRLMDMCIDNKDPQVLEALISFALQTGKQHNAALLILWADSPEAENFFRTTVTMRRNAQYPRYLRFSDITEKHPDSDHVCLTMIYPPQ